MKKQLFALIGAAVFACTSVPVSAAETTDFSDSGYSPDYSCEWTVWNAESIGEVECDGAEKDGGLFSCKWTDVHDCKFTKGMPIIGENITYRDLGEIDCEYEMTYSADGISQYGITGWVQCPQSSSYSMAEYCVVDGYNEWRPCGDNTPLGQVTDNDRTYDIYVVDQSQNAFDPSAKSMRQFFSVITEADNRGTNSGEAVSNHINLEKHFKAWTKAGLDSTGDIKGISFYVSGWDCSGEAAITKNDITCTMSHPDFMPELDTEDALQFMSTAGSSVISKDPYNVRQALRNENEQVSFKDGRYAEEGFACSWEETGGCLFSKGKTLTDPLPCQQLGDIHCVYDAIFGITGNCNFAVRGILTDPAKVRPDVEFDIIDLYRGRKIPDDRYQPLNTVTIDNCDYALYYIEAGTDSNGNPTPAKYLSVISYPEYYYMKADSAYCHIVNIDKHFDAWAAAGLDLDYAVQDIRFQITAFDGDGEINVKDMKIRIGSELISEEVSAETNREGKTADGRRTYKVWTDTQTGTIAFNGDQYTTGEFNCKWDKTSDVLFSMGYDFRNYDVTCDSITPGMTVFDYKINFKADGVASYGICGTLENKIPSSNGNPIEFFIVEGYYDWKPGTGDFVGTYRLDGKTYTLYRTTIQKPDSTGETIQYWAVISDKDNPVINGGTSSHRDKVSIGSHFKEWETRNLHMEGQLYDAALYISSWRCSGEAYVSKNELLYPPTIKTRRGDVDCSGTVDVADAVLLARLLSEDQNATVTDSGKRNADCDGDGTPTLTDVTMILKAIARVINL